MKTQSKPFEFIHPITKKAVRNLRIVTDTIMVTVTGIAYFNANESLLSLERWSVDLDSVIYNGVNIMELLDFTGDSLADIEDAAVRHASELFTENKVA